jgi:predicted transposase YdaD
MSTISKDILWKGILEDLFAEFLVYFYPESNEIFDFAKGFEFLDKELEQLMFPSSTKNRIADKLVKVYTVEGEEKWVLIHLEVQGYEDKQFAERMFTYYYRIWDKYRQKIAALALFTDDKESFRPSRFEMSFLDTSLSFSYKTIKLSDYQPSDFQNSDNPFAIVLETAWYGLAKNKLSDENLFSLKLDLARRLHKKGFSKELFGRICSFIKMYVSFEKPELISKLDNEIDSINKNVRTMGIIEAIQEEIKRQATEEGLEQGLEQGREQGREQGVELGVELGVEKTLKDNINKLYRKGFTVEAICEMLEIPLNFVKNAIQ